MFKKLAITTARVTVIVIMILGGIGSSSAIGQPMFDVLRKGVAARIPLDSIMRTVSPAPRLSQTPRYLPLMTAVVFGTAVATSTAWCAPFDDDKGVSAPATVTVAVEDYLIKYKDNREAWRSFHDEQKRRQKERAAVCLALDPTAVFCAILYGTLDYLRHDQFMREHEELVIEVGWNKTSKHASDSRVTLLQRVNAGVKQPVACVSDMSLSLGFVNVKSSVPATRASIEAEVMAWVNDHGGWKQ